MTTLRVCFAGPGASLQDAGRPGSMHLGVPPGGPLDCGLFALAQRALGNAPHDAAIEIALHRFEFELDEDATVSIDGALQRVRAHTRVVVSAQTGALRYLAVPGGFDVAPVLGGRGCLPTAALGGVYGRYLRRGDTLSFQAAVRGDFVDLAAPSRAPVLTFWPGPDAFSDAALGALVAHPFTVTATRDRCGQRLTGPRLDVPEGSGVRGSAPMVRGALQVTLDGSLVALGPDHPTTGGYPVIGVLTPEASDTLGSLRPGETVRFVDATQLR